MTKKTLKTGQNSLNPTDATQDNTSSTPQWGTLSSIVPQVSIIQSFFFPTDLTISPRELPSPSRRELRTSSPSVVDLTLCRATCGLPRPRPCPWRTCRSPEDCPWTWTCLPECLPRLISASAVDPLSQQYQEFLSLSTCLPPRNCCSELTCEGCHPDLTAYAWCGYLQILGKRQQRQASPKVHFSAKPVISSDLSAQRLGTLSLRKKTSSI